MAFSAETYAILLKKIKSSLSGIGNVEAVPPNKLKFTNVNDGSTWTITLPMTITQQQIDWIASLFDKVIINDTTNDLEYLGIPLNNIVFDVKANFDNNINKLYVDTINNIVYRYNGTTYVQVGGMNKEVIEVVDTLKANPTIDDLDTYCITRTNNKIYRCIYDIDTSKYVWSLTASDVPPTIELLDTLPLESTLTIEDVGRYVLSKDTDEIYKCIEDIDNLGTYIWKNINHKKEVIEVLDDISTLVLDSTVLDNIYFDKTTNKLYKVIITDNTDQDNLVYGLEDLTSKGIQIVDDYSLLPVVTEDTIWYCKSDYTDTSVTPNVEYKSGFYLWDNTASVWTLISSEIKERYPKWVSGKYYKVDDTFSHDGLYYQVIKDFTSSTNFENDEDNFIILKEKYFYLTKEQKQYLEDNIMTDESAIYIISNADEVSDSYEEIISTPALSWFIQHNLNEEYWKLNINIIDTDGNILYADIDLDNTTNNLLVLNFTEEISGKIYIKK